VTAPDGCVSMIDVSAAQGVIAWDSVAAYGVRAAMIEHGVGNDQGNACAAAQVAGARAAGLLVGAYSFLYPIGIPGAGRTPQQQAALHAALDFGPYDLPPVIDLEWPEPAQWGRWGCSASQIVDWVLAYVGARGDSPWLYTMPGFVEALGAAAAPLGRFPLWVANWGVSSPHVPSPWRDWSAWQYSSTGSIPGIAGNVDLSWIRLPPSAVATQPDLGA
jgi:GH25 family lysozyme M1 (1,4-beta-N-acetylmuramidase)